MYYLIISVREVHTYACFEAVKLYFTLRIRVLKVHNLMNTYDEKFFFFLNERLLCTIN